MRVLLTTTGSLGDLHPIMAIGLGLKARGHSVVLATSRNYTEKVINAGLEFAPMGPHFEPLAPEFMKDIFDPIRGPERLIRHILYPATAAVYAELQDALRGADAIVTHPITFAAQIAAEKTGLPWISTVTAPLSIPSKYDPPVWAIAPWFGRLRVLGPAFNGMMLNLAKAGTAPWAKPVHEFRATIGLPKGKNPIFEGQHSPSRTLAMFSRVMAQPQPDWPPQTEVIGFPFFDQAAHEQGLDPALERFLDSGPPPVVFTLGSSAVATPGSFYQESLEAVKRLGCRAVLLAGDNTLAGPLPTRTLVCAYAPFSRILPRAACVIHQGGIGTCGQALLAGRPMLVVPFAFDQPDNAARLERLGVARVLRRKHYDGARAAAALDRLLNDPAYARRAAEAASIVAAEDGVGAACDAIEDIAAARIVPIWLDRNKLEQRRDAGNLGPR